MRLARIDEFRISGLGVRRKRMGRALHELRTPNFESLPYFNPSWTTRQGPAMSPALRDQEVFESWSSVPCCARCCLLSPLPQR